MIFEVHYSHGNRLISARPIKVTQEDTLTIKLISDTVLADCRVFLVLERYGEFEFDENLEVTIPPLHEVRKIPFQIRFVTENLRYYSINTLPITVKKALS